LLTCSQPQFDTIVHAHGLLHAQHTTMLTDATPGQTNFCRVAINNASGVHGDTDIMTCKNDIDDYIGEFRNNRLQVLRNCRVTFSSPQTAVSFDASLMNNPAKKLLMKSNTSGVTAWNTVVGADNDATETFGQCIAGKPQLQQ
jgi:hypothetical protein